MAEVIARYCHFLGIIILASSLVAEHLLLKRSLPKAELKRIAIVDAVYGLAALAVLGAGLSLWLLVGKPADFYSHNPVFHAKVGAFVLMGLISLYPTVFFVKQRRNPAAAIEVPPSIIMAIRLELLLLLVIPLLAVLMAHGFGLPA